MEKKLTLPNYINSCYFRTSIEKPYRKALIQITERCNLNCAHCFVSATNYGRDMSLTEIRNILIPKLKLCKVKKVTITGGEPFIHPYLHEIIKAFYDASIKIGICTNATLINSADLDILKIYNVHCNVSLDGFSCESHGKFRGNKESFQITKNNIELLGKNNLLQGILVTPNNFTDISEYVDICKFAHENNAMYVLMNPLSSMGRGVKSFNKLGANDSFMTKIYQETFKKIEDLEIMYVRFPNENKLPLSGCEAGNIFYVFTSGDVAICPYLVFAAKSPQSLHNPNEFIVGNMFEDKHTIDKLISRYSLNEKYVLGEDLKCINCQINSICKKGCPAAIIATGQRIEGIDSDVCPIT